MSEINTAATNIYDRLRAAPTFHPANADLFTDWNVQAGDVVTIKSDADSYQVPIYNMKLKWTGKPKVAVESTGNPEREPLPAIKRREYGANSSNYSAKKSLGSGVGNALQQTAEINGTLYAAGLQIDPVTGVWLYASEHGADYALGSSFKVQSDAITAEVLRASSAEGVLGSRITETAEEIRSDVYAANSSLYSYIQQTASSITSNVSDVEHGLMTYVQQTASGIYTRMESGTNRTKIQETDPTLDEGYTPKEGDIWVESVHDGTWDGADGYDWEREEPYDWSQLMGARVKVWKNNKWQVVTDRQQMVSYRDVVDTAQAYLDRRISEIINDEGAVDVYIARLERTATELRSEISHATSDFYTQIQQSSSNVTIWVANRPNTVIQDQIKDGKPTQIRVGNLTRAPIAGDLWLDTTNQNTWDMALNSDARWDEDAAYNWNDLRSDKLYKYDGTDWVESINGSQVLYEDTYYEQDKTHQALVARKIEKVDGEWKEGYARLQVQSDRIYADVQDRTGAINGRLDVQAGQLTSLQADTIRTSQWQTWYEGTGIFQNRDNINAVAGKFKVDANGNVHVINGSGLYLGEESASLAVYTNSNLTAGIIVDKINGGTVKIKGANIDVKATDRATWGVYDSDTLTAGIIVDKINNGSVTIKASKINLDGYVTATEFSALKGNFNNLTSGKSTATAIHTTGLLVSSSDFKFDGNDVGWSLWSIGNKTGNYLTKNGQAMTVTYSDLPHYHSVTFNDGKITIGGVTDTAPDPFDVTATTWYKNKIEAAKEIKSVSVNLTGTPTVSMGAYTQSGTATVTRGDGTTAQKSITTDVTTAYNLGWSNGYSAGSSAGGTYTAKSYTRYGTLAYYDDSQDKYVSAGYGYWFLSSYRTMYEKTS